MLTADAGLLADAWPALVALAAVAVLVVYLRRLQFGAWPPGRRWRAVRRDAEEPEEGDLRELVERIERVSLEAGRSLEARCVRLETLIRRADECRAGLEGALAGMTAKPSVAETVLNSQPPRQRRPSGPSAPLPFSAVATESDRVPAKTSPPASAQKPTAEGDCVTRPPPQAGRLDHGADPRAFRVCELAAAGRSAVSIAEELDMPVGEVELVLNIRHFR